MISTQAAGQLAFRGGVNFDTGFGVKAAAAAGQHVFRKGVIYDTIVTAV